MLLRACTAGTFAHILPSPVGNQVSQLPCLLITCAAPPHTNRPCTCAFFQLALLLLPLLFFYAH